MKKLILAFAALTITAASFAQDKMVHESMHKTTFGIGANIGIPMNTGTDVYSISYGADLQADIGVAEMLKATLSAGYQNFSIKNTYGGGSGYFIPVLAGIKYYFSDKFYGHGQLGYGFAKSGGGAFAYAPSIGYNFSENFDASVKYLAFSKSGYTLGDVMLRIAYNF